MSSSTWSIGRFLLYFFEGVLIGTGAILPGISGGVLCVAFGIYEPMMELFVHPVHSFSKQYRFFLPVLLGCGTGFVFLAKGVETFLAVSSVAALSLFSGLICGTVPSLMKNIQQSRSGHSWSVFTIALVAAYALFHFFNTRMEGQIQPNVWWYVFCGSIWGLSMVIPGLSSSSILLFLGLYQPMAQGIGDLNPYVWMPLLVGLVLTIVLTARLVHYLLQHHYSLFSQIILGFVLSSVLMILPLQSTEPIQWLIGIACFAVGFLIARGMDRWKERQERKEK